MARIGIEATRANKPNKTGTEWYAWHLLQEFKKIKTDDQFVVYYNEELASNLRQDAPANFYFKRLPWPFKKLWTHLRLGLELVLHPVDKFFASNAVPFFSRGEMVVTIHDLGFLKHPELYNPLELIYQRLSHALAVKKATKIIVPSQATFEDIKKYYPHASSKTKVIYHGWDKNSFFLISDETKKDIKNKYDLGEEYIICLGRIEAKKNILNLIRAYSALNTDWPLVLVGRPGNFGYRAIQDLVSSLGLTKRVRFLGYIGQMELPDILAAAKIFVFPSKFEGFGLPLIEGMAVGVPVVCSDLPVLREIAGAAALYFNPDKPSDIAAKLREVINDPNLQNILISRGLEQANKFSWAKCAQETWQYILS